MKLSEKITELRKRNGWSQEQLAVKLDVSRQAVYKWEADMNQPDLDKLKRIAHLFGVSYNVLMDDDVDLPESEQIIEVENEEIPVEVIENITEDASSKTVHNEVAVQINCTKETRPTNKRLVVSLCIFAAIIVVCLCALSYIIFGIVLQKDSYLVKFDTGCEAVISDLVVKEGNTLNNITAPTKNGYTFDGWYAGEQKWDLQKDKIKGNTTLTAKWIANESKITYIDYETGNKIEDTAKTDETVVLSANTFKKDGYSFSGWALSPNGEVSYTNCDTFKMGAESITLYAVWKLDEIIPTTFTITYVLNGGVNDVDNPTEFAVGEEIILFDPTKDDEAFGGWYFDESLTQLADEESITREGKNITLYAKWVGEQFDFVEVSDGYALAYYLGVKPIIEIPKSYLGRSVVEILDGAFAGNLYVEEIFIPSSVKRIDVSAFDECLMLTYIEVEDSNSKFSSIDGVLFNKEGTWLYKYPIGRESTAYHAPLSVDVIGPRAFAYSLYLEEVYLPNDPTLTYGIGKVCESAFEGCLSLTTIELGYIANYFEPFCFYNCWSLERIELKADTVWGICDGAFSNCFLLSQVKFSGGSVKEIGYNAFFGCVSLEEIVLNGVEKLGASVFEATGLKAVLIPLSVAEIGPTQFVDCENLTVYCEASSKPDGWDGSWSDGATTVIWNADYDDGKDDTAAEFEYTMGAGVIIITGCKGSGQITIPESIDGYTVKSISAGAFSGQTEITEIIIPTTVTIIDVTAFEDCPALEKITYLSAYTEYRTYDGVLYGDYGRSIVKYPEGKDDEEFEIPYNVDIIRKYAFKNNIHLKKITFPSDVTGDNYVGKIEQGGFEGCVSLEAVEGCAVGYFDKEAFKDCYSLKELTFYAPEISFIMNQVFLNCISLESVTFKGDVGIINWQSFGFCASLKTVAFEGRLEKIGWGSFEDCIMLESINIPNGTVSIGGEAFKGCEALKKIYIPSSITLIEEKAFFGIENLTIYCAASQKPTDWNEKWNVINEEEDTLYHEVLWSQAGLPID